MQAKIDLESLAKTVMGQRGLIPEFSAEVQEEVQELSKPAKGLNQIDYRHLKWCSIDNPDSKDLDQLTYAQKDGEIYTIWVAVADVDALVKKNSAIDQHAQINTTSVYTPSKIFPMLPEKLSTNLTSLNENEDRLAIVTRIEMNLQGEILNQTIEQGIVRNHAKLNYENVGGWLKNLEAPPRQLVDPELWPILKNHHQAAQILRKKRYDHGALSLETAEIRSQVTPDHRVILQKAEHNWAHQLIEEFMIAANQAMAHFFTSFQILSLRRIVKKPKNWNKIVDLALQYDFKLPKDPDSKALDAFLNQRKKASPEAFADLSLTVVKLLGRGEYVVERPEDAALHFGLAITDYAHTTAPNRRYPDLISQRQFKSYQEKKQPPYSLEELSLLAAHCTKQEDAASKVERQLNKSAAALALIDQIGVEFKGIITGADEKNVWVRLFDPLVEGKVVENGQNLDVGDHVRVRLIHLDIIKGFIDFSFISKNKNNKFH